MKPATAAITDPPISPPMLARLVLRWRRNAPSAGVGSHQRRKQGHSLEFRDYRPLQRGDDIRAVDWRASLRQPQRGELLMRNFEAEERLSLLILLDNRPAMLLPEAMPKLLYALWALRALARLCLEQGDEVTLARLRQGPGAPLLTLKGSGDDRRARDWSETLWAGRDQATDALADTAQIAGKLRPAGAVVVLSDMLFDDPGKILAQLARRAQRQQRSLSVVQLDSVAHEIELLRQAQRFHLLRGPEDATELLHLFDETAMAQATSAISSHLRGVRQDWSGGGLDWPGHPVSWPLPDPAVEGLAALALHFTRSFPRLPVLAGVLPGASA